MSLNTLRRLMMSLFLAWASQASTANAAEPLKVKVAAISFVPEKLRLAENAKTLERLFRQAAENGARLAVAPEGALDGYIVNEIIAGEMPAERMREAAISTDHEIIQRFQSLARELKMCLVFGFAERVGEDVYNAAIFVDHQGAIRGVHHKMQLAEGYHPDWWFNRLGKESRAFDTPFGRCGVMICNERWNPDLARICKLDGAQFLVIPAYGSTAKDQDEAVLARSVESAVPVVEANVGVSLVVNNGQIAAVEREETTIVYAEIDIGGQAAPDAAARDEAERRFLAWRDEEMPRRYEETVRRIERRR